MITSEQLYNNFAPYFHSYSNKKGKYIKTVDRIILKNLSKQGLNIADIGCGDGIRGAYLFKRAKGQRLLMIDSSQSMIKLAKKYISKSIEVKKLDISIQLPKTFKNKFDIVLCLWNVLGHIPTDKKRLQALKNIKTMLKVDGKVFIDVSNRYNIRHYGLNKVLYNISLDLLRPSDDNGNFSYIIKINDKTELDSTCHFFNPFEIKNLIRKAGLSINKKFSINYLNGNIQRSIFEGHLFYILNKSR